MKLEITDSIRHHLQWLLRDVKAQAKGNAVPVKRCQVTITISAEMKLTFPEISSVTVQWVDKGLEPMSEYAHVMTADEWNESVKQGAFTPDDGNGYWATETKMDADFDCFREKPKWATHVAWFNK